MQNYSYQYSKSQCCYIKGALCSFGEGIFQSEEKDLHRLIFLLLNKQNRQTLVAFVTEQTE